jgi:hypothetical protein
MSESRPLTDNVDVFADADMPGISPQIVDEIGKIEEDDRTENLAVVVAEDAGLDQDQVTNALLALSHVDWALEHDYDRATLIDYCARLLGTAGLGLKISEVSE